MSAFRLSMSGALLFSISFRVFLASDIVICRTSKLPGLVCMCGM